MTNVDDLRINEGLLESGSFSITSSSTSGLLLAMVGSVDRVRSCRWHGDDLFEFCCSMLSSTIVCSVYHTGCKLACRLWLTSVFVVAALMFMETSSGANSFNGVRTGCSLGKLSFNSRYGSAVFVGAEAIRFACSIDPRLRSLKNVHSRQADVGQEIGEIERTKRRDWWWRDGQTSWTGGEGWSGELVCECHANGFGGEGESRTE